MSRFRDHDKIEVLLLANQGVGKPQGLRGRVVAVHVAVDEEQLALEVRGIGQVRLSGIARPVLGGLERAHILLAPIPAIGSEIMVASMRDAHLEELGMGKQPGSCRIAAAGMTENAHPVSVDPGILGGELTRRRDLVRQAVVDDVVLKKRPASRAIAETSPTNSAL